MARHHVDHESLRFHTPPGERLPALFEDFAAWASEEPWASIAHVELAGGRLDDFWIEDGTRAAWSFVSFMRCGDGTRIGWWRPNGESIAGSPVVLFGSEGELRAIAMDVGDFLAKVVERKTGIYDLEPDDDAAGDFSALRRWLRAKSVVDHERDAEVDATTAALQKWIDDWSRARREIARTRPARVSFAKRVRELIGVPRRDEPWTRTFADMIVTGEDCRLFGNFVGQKPIALSRAFVAEALAFRDDDAQELPEAGPWFRAMLELDADGVLSVKRTYLDEPRADEIRLDDAGLKRDALRAPRAASWTPEWLARRVGRRGRG